jgi:hypothetical protein
MATHFDAGFVRGVRAVMKVYLISPGTVRKHLERIFDKLEGRARTEAAAIYTQERSVGDGVAWPLGSA